MTTAAPARRLDPAKGAARHRKERTSRLRRWWTGWRLALRMARRDVRRDWGRNLFIWAMIAVPITAICMIQVIVASNSVSGTELLNIRLGNAEAVLTHSEQAFTPTFDGYGSALPGADGSSPAAPIPGWGPTAVEQQKALTALLGRPVVATTMAGWTLQNDENWLLSFGGDIRQPLVGGFVQHTGGRLPSTESEALVTPRGIAAGLPASGTVTLRSESGDTETTFTIVGTVEVNLENHFDLVTMPERGAEAATFLVPGPEPVDWALAQRLAGYGIQTTSRGIAAEPPEAGKANPQEAMQILLIELLIAAALLEVALVVGPAFAIGAARQRRSLALAASNGASAAQLRRSVLGQALLVGSTAAVVGALVGTGVGVVLWRSGRFVEPNQVRGPLEVPVWPLGITLLLGVLTAVVAALVPARGLGRMDLVAALRGSLRSPKPRRGAPLVGVVLIAAGGTAAWLARQTAEAWGFWVWFLGGLSVVSGVLLATPGILLLTARIASRLPMSARMAFRDAARQRGRSTSTVAAVLGGTLVLTATWTLVLSGQAVAARGYWYSLPLGHAQVWLDTDRGISAEAMAAAVHRVDPDLQTARIGRVEGKELPGQDQQSATIMALPPGCTPEDVRTFTDGCTSLSTSGPGYGSGILTGPAADLAAWFGLSATEQQALRAGRLLVNTDQAAAADWAEHEIVNGQMRLAYLDEVDEVTQTVSVPASPVTRELIGRGAAPQAYGAVIAEDAAERLGWASTSYVHIRHPRGPISAEAESALAAAVTELSPGTQVYVERGYQPEQQLLLWTVTGTLMLLAVVAALIASIMATLELRPFLGTFAAVGAGQGLSRRLAVVQAGFLALLGSALGVAVGLGIAVPMALRLTGEGGEGAEPILVVPWAVMAGLLVVIPLVAATIAAVTVPARPVLTRRSS